MGLHLIFHFTKHFRKSFSFHRVPLVFTFTFVYMIIYHLFSCDHLCFSGDFHSYLSHMIILLCDHLSFIIIILTNKIIYIMDNIYVNKLNN